MKWNCNAFFFVSQLKQIIVGIEIKFSFWIAHDLDGENHKLI